MVKKNKKAERGLRLIGLAGIFTTKLHEPSLKAWAALLPQPPHFLSPPLRIPVISLTSPDCFCSPHYRALTRDLCHFQALSTPSRTITCPWNFHFLPLPLRGWQHNDSWGHGPGSGDATRVALTSGQRFYYGTNTSLPRPARLAMPWKKASIGPLGQALITSQSCIPTPKVLKKKETDSAAGSAGPLRANTTRAPTNLLVTTEGAPPARTTNPKQQRGVT